jgi:hypothetical protein
MKQSLTEAQRHGDEGKRNRGGDPLNFAEELRKQGISRIIHGVIDG